MALGATTQSGPQIAPINPANLIGRADPNIVEPRATAILTDAFRQGVITADDIMSRIGEGAQAKKKAELQIATEVTSPEAIAAREQQLATQTAQGQVAQAQAERAKVIAQYPAVEYFDKLAAKAGVAEPKLPDGTPDYVEMEKIGLELALNTSEKLAAQQELDNIVTKETNDGSVISAFTKQGAPVDSAYVAKLRSKATKPFMRQTPGTAEVSPTVVAAPVVEARSAAPLEDLNTVRARLAGTFGADVVAPMDEANLRRLDASEKTTTALPVPASSEALVVPRGAAPAPTGVIPTGTPVAGGYSLGNTPKAPAIKAPTEAQQRAQLALARFSQAGDMQAALKEAGYDPTSIGSWMNGMLPQVLKTGDRKQYEAATDAWSQGLLRLESGAAISRQEKDWYNRAFFPQVRDPENVLLAKESMRHDIERMVAEIAQQGGVVSPESAEQARRIYERANPFAAGKSAGGGAAGNELSLPSGKTLVRDANGVYSYK